jgi:hypothetical protein
MVLLTSIDVEVVETGRDRGRRSEYGQAWMRPRLWSCIWAGLHLGHGRISARLCVPAMIVHLRGPARQPWS